MTDIAILIEFWTCFLEFKLSSLDYLAQHRVKETIEALKELQKLKKGE